jgi:MFS family permease
MVTATLTASMLIAQMPAGIWVDRHDRRLLLLLAQSAQVIAALGLLIGLGLGTGGLPLFVGFAVIDGVACAFLGPAREVAIRGIVPTDQLRTAFAQEEARSHAGRVLGPALGGVLFAAGALLPYAATAIGYLAATALSTLARVPRRPDVEIREPEGRTTHRASMLAETVMAARWLIHRPGLREMSLVIMAMNALGGAFTLPLIVHLGELGASEGTTGVVLTGIGIGGLIGAFGSSVITTRITAGHLAILVPTVFGVCLMIAALPIGPWWPFVPVLLFSLVTPALNVASAAVTAQLVPPDMLGRVGAFLTFSGFLLAPLGPLVGGFLADGIGGGRALVVVGGGLVLSGMIAATSRPLRRFQA